MEAKRYRLKVPQKREGEEKTYWREVGVMFPHKDGFVLDLYLLGDLSIHAFPDDDADRKERGK